MKNKCWTWNVDCWMVNIRLRVPHVENTVGCLMLNLDVAEHWPMFIETPFYLLWTMSTLGAIHVSTRFPEVCFQHRSIHALALPTRGFLCTRAGEINQNPNVQQLNVDGSNSFGRWCRSSCEAPAKKSRDNSAGRKLKLDRHVGK